MDDETWHLLLVCAAVILILTIITAIVLIFVIKRRLAFSTVFPVSKPSAESTLPGVGSQSVNYRTNSNVELKKATIRNLNITGMEKESGLI
ncbi:hypothetical protein AB6A40_000384 [Gnathostoma spinigerum]|uniref:Uncharacterized protein n=1 Tax=Gnathostoma spinigerum TaxID=75299 RepID=A0ABD6E2Y2_9BILA